MTPTAILELIKQHGSSAVLVIWILSLQAEVKDMKRDLFDCLQERQVTDNTNRKEQRYERAYFVLPEKKRRKDEYCLTLDC
jgi:hypothetical protein